MLHQSLDSLTWQSGFPEGASSNPAQVNSYSVDVSSARKSLNFLFVCFVRMIVENTCAVTGSDKVLERCISSSSKLKEKNKPLHSSCV